MENPEYFKLKSELTEYLEKTVEARIANERALQAQYIQVALKIAGGALAAAVFVIGFVGIHTVSDIAKKTEEAVKSSIREKFESTDNPVRKYDKELRTAALEAHLWNLQRPRGSRRPFSTDTPDQSISFINDYLKDEKTERTAKFNALTALMRATTDIPSSIGPIALTILNAEMEASKKSTDKDDALLAVAVRVLAQDPQRRYIADIATACAAFPDREMLRSAAFDAMLTHLSQQPRFFRSSTTNFRDVSKLAEMIARSGTEGQKALIDFLRIVHGESASGGDAALERLVSKMATSDQRDSVTPQMLMNAAAAFRDVSDDSVSNDLEMKLYTKLADALTSKSFKMTLEQRTGFSFGSDEEQTIFVAMKQGGSGYFLSRSKYEKFLYRIKEAAVASILRNKGVISDETLRTLAFWLPRGLQREFEVADSEEGDESATVGAYWLRLRVGPEARVAGQDGAEAPFPRGVRSVAMLLRRDRPEQPELVLAWRKDGQVVKKRGVKTLRGFRADNVGVESVFDRIAVISEHL